MNPGGTGRFYDCDLFRSASEQVGCRWRAEDGERKLLLDIPLVPTLDCGPKEGQKCVVCGGRVGQFLNRNQPLQNPAMRTDWTMTLV